MLRTICKVIFGNFERDELKKFIKMGAIFALIIGVYWTLRPLKDSIFIQLVGSLKLPLAKTVSVCALLPLVMFYTKLLEKTSREKMLILLPTFYSIALLFFGLVMLKFQGAPSSLSTQILGYTWYLFVESFGSLVIALFWAFAADTTLPDSAKRGFPLVVAIGQIGGILLPYGIGGLPHRLHCATDALSILVLSGLTCLIIPLIRYFLRSTPPALLTAFQASSSKKTETGFLEGLRLLLKNRYLLGIFGVNFIYEVIVTIFDFNFKQMASMQYSGVVLSHYLSMYASSVNTVALLCLLFGISNITRFLGVTAALVAMPIIFGGAVLGFLNLNSLSFLFALMVSSKAINYALNGPALKQLYIPTSPDVKFKAQAWIETFGSRTSKQAGSMFNMTLAPLQTAFGTVAGKAHYLLLSGVLCTPLLALWLGIALFLGKSFKKALAINQPID